MKKNFIRRNLSVIRAITLVIAGIFFALSGILYVYYISRTMLINDLTYAVESGNIHSFRNRTDWDSIKSSLKQDLRLRMKSVIGMTSGFSMPDEAIDTLVEYYVTPANIPTLFYYKNKYAPNVPPYAFIRSIEFKSINEFTIDLALPPQTDKPWLNYMEPVKLVFVLDGMSWKIKKIITPLYVLPKHSPSAATKQTLKEETSGRLSDDPLAYSEPGTN